MNPIPARPAPGQSFVIKINLSQDFFPEAWMRKGEIIVAGGGSSGATSSSIDTNLGGAGAGASIKYVDFVPYSKYSIIIGAAGPSQTTIGANGIAGGNSSVTMPDGTLLQANGGGIGPGLQALGGTATGGDVNINGGQATLIYNNGSTSAAANGGSSYLSGSANPGANPSGPGGGGGGVARNTASIAGASGQCIIKITEIRE